MQTLYDKINSLALTLANDEIHLGLRTSHRYKPAKKVFDTAVEWLVLEAITSYASSTSSRFSISRNSNNYKKRKPDRTGLAPLGLSYEHAIRDPQNNTGALNSLNFFGYLEEVSRGRYARDGKGPNGAMTSYRATNKLLGLFTENERIFSLFAPQKTHETIILKVPNSDPKIAGESALQFWDDTPETLKLRHNLNVINENMLRHWYDLYIADDTYQLLLNEISNKRKLRQTDRDFESEDNVNFSNRTLRRVFGRGSFEMGGRFYGGWWQNIPSAYRSVITINGYRTIEADYSQFHPNILYHLHQAELTGDDAYERILGPEHRDLSKKIFNACLNSSYETNRPPKGMKISHTGLTWREIKDRLRKAHPQIECAFFTDQGMRLQFYDSQMAELVMLAFAKDKKPILPVHDSFLVLEDDKELLLERMITAYQKVLGKDIQIDLKQAKFMRLPPSEKNVFEEVMAYSGWLHRNDAADEYYGRKI